MRLRSFLRMVFGMDGVAMRNLRMVRRHFRVLLGMMLRSFVMMVGSVLVMLRSLQVMFVSGFVRHFCLQYFGWRGSFRTTHIG